MARVAGKSVVDKESRTPILVVDDEPQTLQSYELALRKSGIDDVIACQDSREAPAILADFDIDIALFDLMMPHVTGEQLLELVRMEYPDIPVIIITGNNDLETAVNCMKLGAFDYMVKPVSKERLASGVSRARQLSELRRENRLLKAHVLTGELQNPEAFSDMITKSEKMFAIFRYAESIARSTEPLLITGETGTGKEMMARSIYDLSNLKGEYVSVNVAGLDDNSFSDTLFGHRKGAFTGATDNRSGLVEKAAGGVLFLDEIGDLSEQLQVKCLRLLQEKEYFPLGSDVPRKTDARIVVATNRPIEELRDSPTFRRDLYYRLRHHHIHIPPLRERKEDLPVLLNAFIAETAKKIGKNPPPPRQELLSLLQTHNFPGNVRELRGMVADAVSSHKTGPLSLRVFNQWIEENREDDGYAADSSSSLKSIVSQQGLFPEEQPLPTLKEIQQILIDEALERAGGNQSIAAKMLGVTRQALNRRILSRERDGE